VSRATPHGTPYTDHSQSFWHRCLSSFVFTAAILLILGVDIALAYLLYRAVLMFL